MGRYGVRTSTVRMVSGKRLANFRMPLVTEFQSRPATAFSASVAAIRSVIVQIAFCLPCATARSIPNLCRRCRFHWRTLPEHSSGTLFWCSAGATEPNEEAALNRLFALDLNSQHPTWHELEPCPGKARILPVAAVLSDSLYIAGGAALESTNGKSARGYLHDAWRYQLGKGWERIADLPRPAVAAPTPAPASDQKFYIFGGDDGSLVGFQPVPQHPGFPKSFLTYDARNNTWNLADGLPVSWAVLPTALWHGRWILPNGEVRPGVRSPEVWSVALDLMEQPIFARGEHGYHTYRIPALAVTTNGTVLAFAEAGKISGGDSGKIDLVCKRSSDNGNTWSDQQVVWTDDENTCGNPSPVVDRDTGVVWLLMTRNLGKDHERDIVSGKSKDTRRVFVTSSPDDGKSWTKPREISSAVKQTNWTWYATGPAAAFKRNSLLRKVGLLFPVIILRQLIIADFLTSSIPMTMGLPGNWAARQSRGATNRRSPNSPTANCC